MKRPILAAVLSLVAVILFVIGTSVRASDVGDTPESAAMVAIGSVTSSAIEVAGDLDYFKFTVPATGTYVIYTRGSTLYRWNALQQSDPAADQCV